MQREWRRCVCVCMCVEMSWMKATTRTRDVTLSTVRLQLRNVNTKQTTHRQKNTIGASPIDTHFTTSSGFGLACVVCFFVLFSPRRRENKSKNRGPGRMSLKETAKEFCAWMELDTNAFAFDFVMFGREDKTYALALSNTSETERVARASAPRAHNRNYSYKSKMSGTNDKRRCTRQCATQKRARVCACDWRQQRASTAFQFVFFFIFNSSMCASCSGCKVFYCMCATREREKKSKN